MASSEPAFNVDGQSFAKGLAWSYEVYCGGARAVFQYTAWEHIGGADTMEQTPMTSSSHNPGHSTSGNMHRWKHMGTRMALLLKGDVHIGNREEQCMLMNAPKQLL